MKLLISEQGGMYDFRSILMGSKFLVVVCWVFMAGNNSGFNLEQHMKTIIEMAKKAGLIVDANQSGFDSVVAFAALVRAEAQAEEREACAKVAGWLWQQFQDTKDAHERNTMESFNPHRFGFNLSTVQQSRQMMDAIRARENT